MNKAIKLAMIDLDILKLAKQRFGISGDGADLIEYQDIKFGSLNWVNEAHENNFDSDTIKAIVDTINGKQSNIMSYRKMKGFDKLDSKVRSIIAK